MKNNLLGNSDMKLDYETLKRFQELPLEQKINLSLRRIQKFIDGMSNNVYVAFSGGKDSTVLLDLVRKVNPNIKGCFINTGLEYPEIKEFVYSINNVDIIKPNKTFKQVIDDYGYPLPSKDTAQKIDEIKNTNSDKLKNKRLYGDTNGNGKLSEKWKFLIDAPFKCSHKCCYYLKKQPAKIYEKENNLFPFIGKMASDSSSRMNEILDKGCTVFEGNRPYSYPLFHWNEKDIWEYIYINNLKYSTIYDKGYKRTGCIFCLFGYWHPQAKEDRFLNMKETHPKLYNYCMYKLGIKEIINYVDDNLYGSTKMKAFFKPDYRRRL